LLAYEYKIKSIDNNKVEWYGVKLMIKRYLYKQCINFNGILSSIVILIMIKVVLVKCIVLDLPVRWKNVFLMKNL